METLLTALGAKTVDWSYKTECCGAGMTMASEETVLDLANKILTNAVEHGANCVVVACPMCHVNLDMKQPAVERKYGKKLNLAVYYLSDVVGLALGLSGEQLGIDRHFVTPASAIVIKPVAGERAASSPETAKTAVAGAGTSTPEAAKTALAGNPGAEH